MTRLPVWFAWLITIVVLAGCQPAPSPAAFDVLIKNGMIYDGAGGEPRRSDLGIKGDQITAIGDLATATAKTVKISP